MKTKTKKSEIYNATNKLYNQYYLYFKQMPITDREYAGKYVAEKLNKLVDMLSFLYFSHEQFSINGFIMILRQIEFKLRNMNTTCILNKKKFTILSKITGDLINISKTYKENNELR